MHKTPADYELFAPMSVIPNVDLCCGSDLSIVNAARRSFDKHHPELLPKDEKLIAYLMREKHFLPFRHPQMSFTCDAPMFVARQLGKHQVGLSWSEVSRRYKTEDIQFYVPPKIREAPEHAKQGTGPALANVAPVAQRTKAKIREVSQYAYDVYLSMLELGIAPEQARAVLPQNMMVRWTWTGSLLAWMHLIRERSHTAAQQETNVFAVHMLKPFLDKRFPVAMREFDKTL